MERVKSYEIIITRSEGLSGRTKEDQKKREEEGTKNFRSYFQTTTIWSRLSKVPSWLETSKNTEFTLSRYVCSTLEFYSLCFYSFPTFLSSPSLLIIRCDFLHSHTLKTLVILHIQLVLAGEEEDSCKPSK